MATAPKVKMRRGDLDGLARHVVYPSGIVSTGWPAVRDQIALWGDTFDEWQDDLGRAVLAKREDGLYAATVGGVVLSIPRQVAKTFLVMRICFALCALFPDTKVLWTAHHNKTLANTFRNFAAFADRARVAKHIKRVRTGNGNEAVIFNNGSMILLGARDQGFGRGFDAVDVIVFDEAQIMNDKALEDMIAATNQSTHEFGALLVYMGTPPRKTDAGEAFAKKREDALSGADGDTLYVEFSADPDGDSGDREQIMKANPSVPHRTSWAAISRMRKNLPSEESWRLEGLGIWYAEAPGVVIAPEDWDALHDEQSFGADDIALGIDVNPERTHASIGMAARRPDGQYHVELVEERRGTAWVVPYVVERVKSNNLRAVVIDGQSPAAPFIDELARNKVRVTRTGVLEMGLACAGFYDKAVSGVLRHIGQHQLGTSLNEARKRELPNGMWAWNRRGVASDITPIVSVTLALWAVDNSKVERPRRGSGQGRRVVVG